MLSHLPDDLVTVSAPSPLRPSGFDLQGHRGARGLRPENTLPAFDLALDLDVTTLELDTVISQDEEVVVSHEPWMNADIASHPDGTPVSEDEARSLNLFQMPYTEIARYDVGQRGNPRFPEQVTMAVAKPRLRDVIERAEAKAARDGRPAPFYNIETKCTDATDGLFHPSPEQFTALLWDVFDETGIAPRATLQSFDVRTLQEAHRLALPIRLALLVAYESEHSVTNHVARLGFVPHIYSPDYRLVDADLMMAAASVGMDVIPWTVNDPDEAQRLRDLGVAGLITDYPDRVQ
ncbi:MAG: glycerophosphodiester phosphodiesterase family protein [Bacteroidota bacterium]